MNIKGIGTDIADRSRFSIENEDLNNRFLSLEEKEVLSKLKGEDIVDFLSGRWAAKESIVKASNKEIIFSSISILKDENGKPCVYIDGNHKEEIHISISHEKSYTISFCIIEKV